MRVRLPKRKRVAKYVNTIHGHQPARRWWSAEEEPHDGPRAEIVVKGRNVEIPDHFRTYVSEKLARLERFDRTIYLFDVELDHERNRRQRKNCQHVRSRPGAAGPSRAAKPAPTASTPRWNRP